MIETSNPDRIFVSREFRATIHLGHTELQSSTDLNLPGVGAALVNLSPGGCCVRLPRHDIPFSPSQGTYISSIKLIHPELESSPIQGRITWSREEPPHVLIGIQFLQMRSETLKSIQSLVESRKSKSA